jgi:hypothetical protein
MRNGNPKYRLIFSLYAKCAIYSGFVKDWLNPEIDYLMKNGKRLVGYYRHLIFYTAK